MPFIGNTPQTQSFAPAIDYFSGNGVTVTFTLSRPVVSVAQLTVAVDNVIQNPSSAFTVSGNSITFTSAPLSGTNNIWVEYTSLITTYAAISQDPSVIGDITATGGFLAEGDFGNSYIDGTIVDYVTGNARITTGPIDDMTFYHGGTSGRSEMMRLSYAGNSYIVGSLGINTTSPTEKLDVVGNTDTTIRARAASDTALILNETTPNKSWKCKSSDGTLVWQYSSTAYNSGYSSKMAITSTGNVGLGTTNPGARFEVAGTTTSTTMQITTTTGAPFTTYRNTGQDFYVGLDNSAGASFGSQYSANLYGTGAYPMLFWTNGTERMRITSTGELLVGGTNNADVTSNQTPEITSQPTSNTNTTIQGFPVGLALRNTANTNASGYGIAMKFHFSGGEAGKYSAIAGVADGTYANQTALAFYTNPNGTNGADNNTQRMYIASNGSIGAPSGTNIYNASDARVKQNINDLPVGLAQIMQLRPVSYNWKEDFCKEENGKLLYGFVAQETQAVDETLIEAFGSASVYYKGEDEELVEVTNPLRVNEKFIVPMLVKAIQELKAEVDSLKAQLEAK